MRLLSPWLRIAEVTSYAGESLGTKLHCRHCYSGYTMCSTFHLTAYKTLVTQQEKDDYFNLAKVISVAAE